MRTNTDCIPYLVFCLALVPSMVKAQPSLEWFYKAPEVNGTPYAYGGIAFSRGGLVYFGTGVDATGQPSDLLFCYDPLTNQVNICSQVPGSPRRHGVAFTIGMNAYVGLGDEGAGGAAFADIQRLNGNTGYFDLSYTFPGGLRSNAVVFTINNKAYIGGGNNAGLDKNDLWEWDPASNVWTAKANMPASISGGAAFAAGGKGYLLREGFTQFWCYDPVANNWTVKAPFPGGQRAGSSAFELSGFGYVGLGDGFSGPRKDFFVYDPVANSWSSAPYIWSSYGRFGAMVTAHLGKAYVTGGYDYLSTDFDLWEFGPVAPLTTGVWVQRPFLPAPPRDSPISFTIGSTAYLGGGTGTSTFTDFWAYDPDQRVWTTKAALPGSLVAAAAVNGKGYGLRNTPTANFWSYDPVANAWSPRADMPVPRASTVAFGLEGKIWVTTGMANSIRLNDLWAYDPLTDSWEQRASRPGNAVHAAAAFALGNKAIVLGGNTGGTTTATSLVYRYDPASDAWASVQSMPFPGNVMNPMAFAVGNIGYAGGGALGGSLQLQNTFRVFDPMSNTWSSMPTLGGGSRLKGAAFTIDGRGFIACGSVGSSFSNQRTNDLWEFQPAWVTVAPRVFLGGPFIPGSGLMSAALNDAGLVPLTDPYAALLHPRPGGDFSHLYGGLSAMTGNNAIVDRVVVELRDAGDPSIIRAARHVWLQRDGDVVDMDGSSPVRFTLAPGNYHVAIRHRNHLGCMSASPVALSGTAASINFTSSATPTWGTDARKNVSGTMVLWPGDATANGQIRYTGSGNDRDPILLAVGSTTPNNAVSNVYDLRDNNMDGVVRYTGTGNDRDIILTNVGSTTPNNTRTQQLP